MAEIRHRSGRLLTLQPHSLVGRSPLAQVRLTSPVVSLEHAAFHLFETTWYLRDLGSRNGTFLNGKLLSSDQRQPLAQGDVIVFGDEQEEWRIESVAATRDTAEETLDLVETTSLLSKVSLAQLELIFSVSADGNDVALSLDFCGRKVSLGTRASFYPLLYLARARLDDRQKGIVPAEEGWRSRREVLDNLRMTKDRLNVEVYRARQVFERLGVVDSADLVLLRRASVTLRLGAERVRIE